MVWEWSILPPQLDTVPPRRIPCVVEAVYGFGAAGSHGDEVGRESVVHVAALHAGEVLGLVDGRWRHLVGYCFSGGVKSGSRY